MASKRFGRVRITYRDNGTIVLATSDSAHRVTIYRNGGRVYVICDGARQIQPKGSSMSGARRRMCTQLNRACR